MVEQIQNLLELGISNEITFAKESLNGTITQLISLQEYPGESSKFFPQFLKSKMLDISDKYEVLRVIDEEVLPAFQKYQDFLETKYMKHARKGPGVISFGNLKGEEYYQACLEHSTSIKNINATDLYQFGMQVNPGKYG